MPSAPSQAGGPSAGQADHAVDSALGLSAAEAAARLAEHGPNRVERERGASAFVQFARQFESPLIWLLLGACVVAAALGEIVDAAAIGAIVVLNSLVGFFQEHRAERAVLALRAMTAPRARVLRDGHAAIIPAAEVVPDDILLLEAGDVVAADARVVEAHALLANEAALTGESLPGEKGPKPVPPSTPLAERTDSVFMGTAIANGTGKARVEATGMRTELGKIAHLLSTAREERTPLQERLARVSRVLLFACLGIVALVAVLGVVRGLPRLEVFLSAVSLAVAAVPEGLPAVVTIALAIGVQRMVARHVLVRRLPAVETLGCATVICTDKTGTLTTGVMAVRELWGQDHAELLRCAAACCDADLAADERTGTGDPTEVALLVAAAERGVRRADIERGNPRVHVRPFDSERKRMSVGRADGVLYVKGAVEFVLPLCQAGGEDAPVANQQMAERGLRVLAVATGHGEREENLALVGLVGIADPPRTEAIEAVAVARRAGIRTVMITGDHAATARAIAHELGILVPGETPDDIVHARATPQDKLDIVRRWKDRGDIVAMTGDGVNDAPALREAHIGVAMGKTGTEVTREASDMILTDDNFASIVAAVREGRGIFDNIRKTLVYVLAGNASELTVMLGAALFGLPLPLLPLHLLWINLVTDGLPALALVTDPVEADAMQKPPRKPDEPMLARGQWRTIGLTAAVEGGVVLAMFAWALQARDLTAARSMAFSVLVFAELFRAFAARSARRLFWEVGALTNMWLLAIVALTILLQIGLHHVPWTQAVFQIDALAPSDWAIAVGCGLVPATVLELRKLVGRGRRRRRATAVS
jgi:Ca2+-transporting ATPase